MASLDDIACRECGAKEGFDEEDGFFYCRRCLRRADDMMETDFQNEDYLDKGNSNYHLSVHRLRNVQVKTENTTLLSQLETQHSVFWRGGGEDDHKIPKQEEYTGGETCIPNDFGAANFDASQLSPDDLSSEIRIRYVMGIQLTVQYQCRVLVEKFGASPLICGLAGVIWMRFVAASRVFDDDWADKTFEDSEVHYQGFSEERTTQSSKGTFNMYGQSGVMIWFRSLRKRIPIYSSLVVSFLACHVAREPILPTDIRTWALEGKLPYLTAFIDIEKSFGRSSSTCPLSPSIMFKPFKVVGSRELEAQSGFVAQSIGLQLPPVNFFAIARRYLKQLSLPPEKILPHAVRIYEWSMPPDLWLSANPKRLPTRVCVMSILMLTIRLLYNINGFGKWEASLCTPRTSSFDQLRHGGKPCFQSFNTSSRPEKTDIAAPSKKRKSVSKECSQPVKYNRKHRKTKNSSRYSRLSKRPRGMLHIQNSEFDTTELLCKLEAIYEKTHDAHEYSKNLPTYLKYCKDVVFAGLKPLLEDNEEERVIEKLWGFYERQEDTEEDIKCYSCTSERRSVNNACGRGAFTSGDRPRSECHTPTTSGHDRNSNMGTNCDQDEGHGSLKDQENLTSEEAALKQMKLNMEENGFCYIPPRVKLKRFDHLHYIRKNDGGTRSYVAHADYYILLRACAQVAQVGVRYMHAGALKLEKRLSWIENRIDQSLQFTSQHPPSPSTADVDPPEDMDLAIGTPEDITDSLDLLNFNFII